MAVKLAEKIGETMIQNKVLAAKKNTSKKLNMKSLGMLDPIFKTEMPKKVEKKEPIPEKKEEPIPPTNNLKDNKKE